MNDLVSIVIPTFNRRDSLERLLISIINSTWKNIEIIVVNDNSSDDTSEFLLTFSRDNSDLSIVVLTNERSLGASGSKNRGAEIAQGSYLFFLDDDTELLPETISELVIFMKGHEHIGLVAPAFIDSYDKGEREVIPIMGIAFNFLTSRAIGIPGNEIRFMDTEKLYPTIASMNGFIVRKDVFMKVGGYDTWIEIMYDEGDLGMKIDRLGYKQYVVPTALCIHHGALRTGENNRLRAHGMATVRRAFTFARNRTVFMRRYAPWYGKVTYLFLFSHLFCIYYVHLALSCRRKDIAISYLEGYVNGFLCSKHTESYDHFRKYCS